MSWKLAEWRWREHAPLRERSLWKIWDADDAVKQVDVVEEAVSFAYRLSEQVDGCWRSRIETPQGGKLGSIESGTDPHPQHRTELPDSPPQFHTSYHPSYSSSAPLLAKSRKTSPQVEDFHSTASSLSALFGWSIGNSSGYSPPTPQLPTDFLDNRDWNHLALDQVIDRKTAVSQLRSSFGLFTKAAHTTAPHRRARLSLRDFSLATESTSEDFRSQRLVNSNAHVRKTSTPDFDEPFLVLKDHVVPWSNLDTAIEEQQRFVELYFRPKESGSDILNPQSSLHDYSAVLPETSSGGRADIHSSLFNVVSLLLPEPEMGCFKIDKSEDDENKRPKAPHIDTPLAKVFPDLPTHSGIVGQSATPSKIMAVQEIRNMTGPSANLSHLIYLPRTPAQSSPASAAIQPKHAEAKASRECNRLTDDPKISVNRLLLETPNLRLLTPVQHQAFLSHGNSLDDNAPVGEFVSSSNQTKELLRMTSYESGLKQMAIVRSSRSFFDLAGEYRLEAEHALSRFGSSSRDDKVSTSGTFDRTIDEYPRSIPSRASNVLVRNSCDIIDVAIAAEEDRSCNPEEGCEPHISAALPVNRLGASTGRPSHISLPLLPKHLFYRPETTAASSEAVQYENTQSLLNAGSCDSKSDIAKHFETQLRKSKKEHRARNFLGAAGNADAPPFPGNQSQLFYDSDEFAHGLVRYGPRQPGSEVPNTNPLRTIPSSFDESATAPYHNALKIIYNVFESTPQDTTQPGEEAADHDRMSPRISDDKDVSDPLLEGNFEDAESEEIVGLPHRYCRDLDSGDLFAYQDKKGLNEKQKVADDCDWETVRGSGFQSELPFQPTPQPPFEPQSRATYTTNTSLVELSTMDTFSTVQGQPATPWDPLRKDNIRIHPGLPTTPHKQRLRTDQGTGAQIWVPEYSLPEIQPRSSSSEQSSSAQTAPDLSTGQIFVSKSTASTTRQPALGKGIHEKQYTSSPPVTSQDSLKLRMATAPEEQELVQGRVVHELEGDQGYVVVEGGKPCIPKFQSAYSLSGDDIVQDEAIEVDNAGARRPNITSMGQASSRTTTNDRTSNGIPVHDETRYGQPDGGIEMIDMRLHTLPPVSNFDRNSSNSSGYLQFNSSEASLPFKPRLLSQGRYESGEDLMKRLSTIDDDGSYYEADDLDVASISSIMHEHDLGVLRPGTFNKRAVLGTKDNITGTLRGTGMRGTGSSPANVSSDAYDPAMQCHHSYHHLSSSPEGGYVAGTAPATDVDATPHATSGARMTREQLEGHFRNKGVDLKDMLWGNVQSDITGITFPAGYAISAPRDFQLPRTVPPANSFALTKANPLVSNSASYKEVEDRVHMAIDDWSRLQSDCPQFPLRDSHLTMKFTKSDPRRTGDNVYNRGGISRLNGRLEEDGFCFVHSRREFSTIPSLRPTALTAENLRLQKIAGRQMVWTCLSIPVIGWVLLYYVWKQDPTVDVSRDLMLKWTSNVVGEMGEEELDLAGRVLLWGAVGAFGVLLACLGVLLWAFL